MKNLIKSVSLSLLLLVSIVLVSCDGPKKSQLEGTWGVRSISENGFSFIPIYGSGSYATFNSNGTFKSSGDFGSYNGIWRKNGKDIYITQDGERVCVYTIQTITDDEAGFKIIPNDSDPYWVICYKWD